MEVIKDKLKRLGIPLLFYTLILSPIIIYLTRTFVQGSHYRSVIDFFTNESWLTFGPLWFIVALLLFTFIALFFKSPQANEKQTIPLPNESKIVLFALTIALISYWVRTWYPVGRSLEPFGFQLAHFTQYIALFYIGIMAARNRWFAQISYQQGKKWLIIVLFMILVLFPIGFYLGGAIDEGTEIFMGGWTWQSLFYCFWEQMVGIGIMMALIGIFKEKYNKQNSRLKAASASAYTVYIIHALVLVACSLLIKDLPLPSTVKLLGLAPIVLLICFGLGNIVRQVPYFRGIL